MSAPVVGSRNGGVADEEEEAAFDNGLYEEPNERFGNSWPFNPEGNKLDRGCPGECEPKMRPGENFVAGEPTDDQKRKFNGACNEQIVTRSPRMIAEHRCQLGDLEEQFFHAHSNSHEQRRRLLYLRD